MIEMMMMMMMVDDDGDDDGVDSDGGQGDKNDNKMEASTF